MAVIFCFSIFVNISILPLTLLCNTAGSKLTYIADIIKMGLFLFSKLTKSGVGRFKNRNIKNSCLSLLQVQLESKLMELRPWEYHIHVNLYNHCVIR